MKITIDRGKTPQFSKIWLGVCITVSLIFTAASYVLAALDKDPLSGLSAELIGALWGTSGTSFVSYVLQNCVRAYTSSKFGLPEDSDTEEENGDIHE